MANGKLVEANAKVLDNKLVLWKDKVQEFMA